MNARISKISLVVFGVLLLLSGFLLSTPGNYWPWFAVMSGFTVVPVALGPSRYRLIGAIAALVSVALIIFDIKAGIQFKEKREKWRHAHPVAPATQQTP